MRPRQHDDAQQSLRQIEPITCVMSSYPRSESSCTPPSSPQAAAPTASTLQLWSSRAACTGCTPAPVVAQRRAYRQTQRTARVPWDFWASCTACTVGTRLCCTTGMVRQTEDELNLRDLQLELVDCWNVSLKSITTSITGIPTDFCTVAPPAASASALSPSPEPP